MKQRILTLLENHKKSKRIALSVRYPFLKPVIIRLRKFLKNRQLKRNSHIAFVRKNEFFPCVIARHQSVLRRKLGDSNPHLQEQKIINIAQAIKKFDGIIIEPGKIFSFWHILGEVSYKNGFVDGMLISRGKVVEGVGGGLCQLANLLYWIFLHTPTEIIERYHHSLDLFPDSGRVLPFWSGATIVQNYIDLQIKNTSKNPIQIKIWLTNTHLKCQLLSPTPISHKYHIFEKNHCFVKNDHQFFRYNQIFRETKIDGKVINCQQISENFAPVMYDIDEVYCRARGYDLLIV